MDIQNGIWPTMMMPMNEDLSIDYEGIERLLSWYADQGAHGVFALCYSSEIRAMTKDERIKAMRFIADHMPREMSLAASGHVADDIDEQIDELRQLKDNGAPVLVLIANRLAKEHESENVLLKNAERILNAFPDMPFGIYECPYPYYRLLTPETLGILAHTGRFVFMKDTCCDLNVLRKKLEFVNETPLRLFNANAATLLDSWQFGAAGFCGIMCNFHTDLYVRMYRAFVEGDMAFARILQNALGVFSCFERLNYPVSAKIYLNDILHIGPYSRIKRVEDMKYSFYTELEELRAVEEYVRGMILQHDSECAKG